MFTNIMESRKTGGEKISKPEIPKKFKDPEEMLYQIQEINGS